MAVYERAGLQVVLEGVGPYVAGANRIESANRGLETSFRGVGSAGISLAGGLAKVVALVGTAAAALGGLSVVKAAGFEVTLARIDALTNTTTEDTEKLGEGILKMAKRLPKSPEELGEAAYIALSSGIQDVGEALEVVENAAKASAAGLGSTKDIVDIVTAALNAYGHENLTAARATDILIATVREGKGEPAQMATALGSLLPLAAALKIPFEDLASVFASLTNTMGGTGGAEQAATQLRGILSQLASPSKQAKDALAEAQAGVKGLSAETLALAEAQKNQQRSGESLASAQRSLRSAQDDLTSSQGSLARANEAVARAQRDATQAAFEARRESLSLEQAQLHLSEVQARNAGAQLEIRDRSLAVAEAQQALNEARKDKDKDAIRIARAEQNLARALAEQNSEGLRARQRTLDLKSAELTLAETRSRIGNAQKQQADKLADAERQRDKVLADGREKIADAQRAVKREQEDYALASQKATLEIIHQRDAFGQLRKEIAEKGLVPALQNVRDLFGEDLEGLGKLFPDVRGFIGFLSAIESQGAATAAINDRIRASAGLTAEAWDRMNKTAVAQWQILKNQLNVALIELGSHALPSVTGALQDGIKYFPTFLGYLGRASDLVRLGFKGGKIGGEITDLEKALFKIGEYGKTAFDFVESTDWETLRQGAALTFDGLVTTLGWLIDHKEALAGVFAIIGAFFLVSNPIWAGILVGGAILLGIGAMGAAIEELATPFLVLRKAINQMIIDLKTFLTLGTNRIPGFKDLVVPEELRIDPQQADIKAIDAELARRNKVRRDAAEEARRLREDEAIALAQGLTYEAFLRKQIEDYIALAGVISTNDQQITRLIEKYSKLSTADQGALAGFRDKLREGDQAAIDLVNSLDRIKPPNVGDAGLPQLQAATTAADAEAAATAAVSPPDVGDAGAASLGIATTAAQLTGAAVRSIGTSAIAAQSQVASASAAMASSLSIVTRAIDSILKGVSNIGKGGSSTFGNVKPVIPHANGGIFFREHTARIAEGGRAEAVIPLTNPPRARAIMGAMPFMGGARGSAGGGASINVTAQGYTLADTEKAAVRGVREAHRRARSSTRRMGAFLSHSI